MQSNLRAVTAAGIERCRDVHGLQFDAAEVAYTACLLEEQQSWSAARPSSPQTAAAAGGAEAAVQLPQKLSLCTGSKLPGPVLTAMADRLRQELVQPADPAAAATARLQVNLEQTYKAQQEKVEAELAQHTNTATRLASAVAYKKVNMQAAGLPLYQAVFDQIVHYVCAAAGLEAKALSDADARAQVAAAVESVLPLSGLAYFLTLPAQERMQQLESLAAISCGICLFNSHTGNAPSPVALSADTQLLQASRLLTDIQAASAQAEAALDHHNRPMQHTAAPGVTSPALAAAAASYLGTGSAPDAGGGSESSGAAVQLGAALFCCQAAGAFRALAVDLAAGISCCRQLHHRLLSVLVQAAQATVGSPGPAVLKEQVFPLFESAGRVFVALKGELRLLLVRGRLWEATCAALSAAAQQPGIPKVLGFSARRRLGHGSSTGSSGSGSSGRHTGGSLAVHSIATEQAAGPAAVFDASSLPAEMEFVGPLDPEAAFAAASVAAGFGGSCGISDGSGSDPAAAAVPPEQQLLALLGMCPVSVAGSIAAGAAGVSVEGEEGAGGTTAQGRLLVGCTARPELGIIRYAGQLYGFSSPAALAAFVAAPESTLDAVLQAAHNAPLLLHMLGLSAAPQDAAAGRPTSSAAGQAHGSSGSSGSSPVAGLPAGNSLAGGSAAPWGSSNAGGGSSAGGSAGGGEVRWRMPPLRGLLRLFEAPLKVDAGTQTVTHVVERLVDVDYEWNAWALRRRILALANLRHKATHSTQTLSSGFRKEGSSQTWLPKEAAVQTKADKGSSVPKKLRYVTGLRGPPDTRMKVVSLELDVHGKGASVKPGHL